MRDQVALFAGDLLSASQKFDVRRSDVGDDSHGRLRDFDELRDLAAVIHPEFHDECAVGFAPAEQRERQPVLIVQISGCPMAGCAHGQDRRAHFLGGRLAIAARDRDDGPVKFRAMARGEGAECARGVFDGDDGNRERVRQRSAALDDQRGRAPIEGVLEEIMPVVAGARDCVEELTALDGARVDRNSGEDRRLIAANQRTLGPAHRISDTECDRHRELLASRALRACSRSSKCRRSGPTIW